VRKEHAHEHTGSAESIRPSLRNGFTAYFVLSPVNGSFATVASGTPRSIQLDRCATANLTPAPRRQDHTTSPSASCAFVFAHSASTASHRTFVTIASRPSLGETRGVKSLICPTG
jgi:hypothetical protein